MYRAFLHNQLIFAFEETAHNREYTADAHVYPAEALEQMIADVKAVMNSREQMEHHLKLQLEDAMAEEKEVYKKLLD